MESVTQVQILDEAINIPLHVSVLEKVMKASIFSPAMGK